MKLNLSKFYVVYKPTKFSVKADVFDGRPTNLKSLSNEFKGGLTPSMVVGIYTTKAEAEIAAEKAFSKRKIKD